MTATGTVRAERPLGARIAAVAGGGVMRVFLVLVALFWLMPTIGLLLSSLRHADDIAASQAFRKSYETRSSPPRPNSPSTTTSGCSTIRPSPIPCSVR